MLTKAFNNQATTNRLMIYEKYWVDEILGNISYFVCLFVRLCVDGRKKYMYPNKEEQCHQQSHNKLFYTQATPGHPTSLIFFLKKENLTPKQRQSSHYLYN